MNTCEVCGKELVGDEQPQHLYVAQLIGKAVQKGGVTKNTLSQYKDFKPVDVPVCSRHKNMVTVQKINSGTIAMIPLFIVFLTAISYLADWNSIGVTYLYLVALVVTLVPVILLTRFITYERLVVRMLNITRKAREARIEYFTPAQFKKITGRAGNSEA